MICVCVYDTYEMCCFSIKTNSSPHISISLVSLLVIYQFSCRLCSKGLVRHNIIGKTSEDLKKKIESYYQEVCNMVLAQHVGWFNNDNFNRSSSRSNKEKISAKSFRRTKFANHIVKHCQNDGCTTNEKVMDWCRTNIKVEIFGIELD